MVVQSQESLHALPAGREQTSKTPQEAWLPQVRPAQQVRVAHDCANVAHCPTGGDVPPGPGGGDVPLGPDGGGAVGGGGGEVVPFFFFFRFFRLAAASSRGVRLIPVTAASPANAPRREMPVANTLARLSNRLLSMAPPFHSATGNAATAAVPGPTVRRPEWTGFPEIRGYGITVAERRAGRMGKST